MTIEELAIKKRLPLLVPSALLMHSTLHREKKRKKINTKEKGMVHRQRWVSQIKKKKPGLFWQQGYTGEASIMVSPSPLLAPFLFVPGGCLAWASRPGDVFGCWGSG